MNIFWSFLYFNKSYKSKIKWTTTQDKEDNKGKIQTTRIFKITKAQTQAIIKHKMAKIFRSKGTKLILIRSKTTTIKTNWGNQIPISEIINNNSRRSSSLTLTKISIIKIVYYRAFWRIFLLVRLLYPLRRQQFFPIFQRQD